MNSLSFKQKNSFKGTSEQAPIKLTRLNHVEPLNEEQIKVKVPTPYPRAQYMILDSNSLKDSEYTSLLNEKFPSRKYLRHNQQSFDKILKYKKNDIDFFFLDPKERKISPRREYENPKLNIINNKKSISDYNFKILSYKNEEIDPSKITNLQNAIEITERLQPKLIEFEISNNENIQKANTIINQLKMQKEVYIKKLNEIYDNMYIIEKKYHVDIDHPYPEDPVNILIRDFRRAWLKRNFFYCFLDRINQQREIKFKYYEMLIKREKKLKLKSLIGFEKMQNIKNFKKSMEHRRNILTSQCIFNLLRKNVLIKSLKTKFCEIQRNLLQLLYLKELKLRVYQLKGIKSHNKKSLVHYYSRILSKVLKALKFNVFHNKKYNKSLISMRYQNSNSTIMLNPNYLQFSNALSKKYKWSLTPEIKENKLKGMKMLKSFIDKILLITKTKMVNNPYKDILFLLKYYFQLWKQSDIEDNNILQCQIFHRKTTLRMFFKKVTLFHMRRHYKTIKDNKNVKKGYLKLFLYLIRELISLKKKMRSFRNNRPLFIKQAIFKKMLTITQNDKRTKFNRLKRRWLYESFFEKLKHSIKATYENYIIKKNTQLYHNNHSNIMKIVLIMILKNKILKRHYKYDKIKKLINRHYISKYLNILSKKTFIRKEFKIREYYEKNIFQFKKIIMEKTGMINKLQYDNRDLTNNFRQNLIELTNCENENSNLHKTLDECQIKQVIQKRKYAELLFQAEKDIKILQSIVQNNENLLTKAEKREEELQRKYCDDIENAVRLHKNLNEIITKKNFQLVQMNKTLCKENQEINKEKIKLKKQNALLYSDISSTLHHETMNKYNESNSQLENYEMDNRDDNKRITYEINK